MGKTALYNDFRPLDHWRTRYRRSMFEIWDANLHHGDVRPFACPEEICDDTGVINKFYDLEECDCFGFDDDRDIVQGFCDDQYFHIDGGTLRQATAGELCLDDMGCRAGVPVGSAPNASGGCGGCDGIATSYVITYVTEHAGIRVEGPPSPPSDVVVTSDGGGSVSWSGAPAGYCVVATRLYRVESKWEDGTTEHPMSGSEFVFVREFGGGGGGNYNDGLSSDETGAPLTTYDPMGFPAPTNLVSVVRTTDGVAVADQNRIYISQAGKPQFTWDGVIEIEDTILAMVAINNTILVFTDRYPVKVSYQLGQGLMSVDKQVIYRNLPLKSKKSLSLYDGRVFFASTYSLYVWDLSGYGADINSTLNALLTPEQWKNIGPESVVGTAYEYGYIFSSDEMNYSLMMEIGEDGTDTVNKTSLMPISYVNPRTFGLDRDGHIIYQTVGQTTVHRWDYRRDFCVDFYPYDNERPTVCESCECCPWKIKLYYDNEGKNHFNHMRVEFDEQSGDTIQVRFYAHEFGREFPVSEWMEITNSRGFGLPTNLSYQAPYAHLTSCAIMHEVRFATSAQELVASSNRLKEV